MESPQINNKQTRCSNHPNTGRVRCSGYQCHSKSGQKCPGFKWLNHPQVPKMASLRYLWYQTFKNQTKCPVFERLNHSNPDTQLSGRIITPLSLINYLNQGCVWGISLYHKLWIHLESREKLDLRSTIYLLWPCLIHRDACYVKPVFLVSPFLGGY